MRNVNEEERSSRRGFVRDDRMNVFFKFFHLLYFYYFIFFFSFFFFSFTKLLFKFLSRFFDANLILSVADNLQLISEDKKGKCQLKVNIKVRERKREWLQLFLSNFFYFPYCSRQLRTLCTFLQREYCFILLPKIRAVYTMNNEETSQPSITSYLAG